MTSSHIQSPVVLFIVFSFARHVNLLTLDLSLSLDLRLCHLPLVRRFSIRIVLPAYFLFADPFLFHTFRAHPALSVSCFSSFGLLALLGVHWKSRENRKTSLWQQDQWTRPWLTWNIPFSSFLHFFPLSTYASLFISLLCPGISFPHTILFLSILLLYQFSIPCHLCKGRDRHQATFSVPARFGCWEVEK